MYIWVSVTSHLFSADFQIITKIMLNRQQLYQKMPVFQSPPSNTATYYILLHIKTHLPVANYEQQVKYSVMSIHDHLYIAVAQFAFQRIHLPSAPSIGLQQLTVTNSISE